MMVTQSSDSENESWEKFCALRLGYLRTLAEVVEQGFIRRDTEHPAFCGCIDWHSSVHGAYALLAVARLTGDYRWAAVVDAILTTKCLDGELESLQNSELDHELPYGYAWLLKLAIERERWWGKMDLRSLASEVAARLEQWMFALSAGDVIRHFQRREYGNLSWALLNLWEWSQWTTDLALREKLHRFTRMWVVLLDEALPVSYDNITEEFFAASLQRTRAILSILPREESLHWLKAFHSEEISFEPMQIAVTPHSAGLNFSRAWAFWTLYGCTGNELYKELYVNHIVTHINQPQCWRDDYRKHAHWVPQFGIYAIALSLEKVEI